MNQHWEKLIANTLEMQGKQINLSQQQYHQILRNIHLENSRRNQNIRSKGKRIFFTAAAIIVLGTMTVIAAGKAVSYQSGINTKNIDYPNAHALKNVTPPLGQVPKVPQQFSNKVNFIAGYQETVEGFDEQNNLVESYPAISIHYDDNIFLEVTSRHQNENPVPVTTRTIEGIVLRAYCDNYLFLPPQAAPTEADLICQSKGELFISYGSDQEERTNYRYISWQENGLSYSLSTFNESYQIDDLMAMAIEVLTSNP